MKNESKMTPEEAWAALDALNIKTHADYVEYLRLSKHPGGLWARRRKGCRCVFQDALECSAELDKSDA